MIRAVQFRLALVATVLLLQISFHTAHASVSTLGGDVDGNGEVETTDLDMVISCFGQTAPLLPPCDDADVAPPPDGDGMVNLLDILLVGSNFIPTGGRLCVVKGRADGTWNLEARVPAPGASDSPSSAGSLVVLPSPRPTRPAHRHLSVTFPPPPGVPTRIPDRHPAAMGSPGVTSAPRK